MPSSAPISALRSSTIGSLLEPARLHYRLDDADTAQIMAAAVEHRFVAARREVLRDEAASDARLLILEGWAALVKLISNGRRQILYVFLPGDIAELANSAGRMGNASVLALTDVSLCKLPANGGFDELYDRARVEQEGQLLRHITRLGRFSAYERVVDWVIEIAERLHVDPDERFALPITQEVMADVLGLTGVHVNRTINALRQDRLIDIQRGQAHILDRAACLALVDRPKSRPAPTLV